MSFTIINKQGNSEVVYTDGLCFCSKDILNLPGLKFKKETNSISSKLNTKSSFFLEEGIWWMPVEYRLCVFNGNEILNNTFMDITERITVYANTFISLEKEIEMPPFLTGMDPEIYYDINFFTEEVVLNKLKQDINLIDKGNLNFWRNKIELIDLIYNS
jgi:hypothetical protein